MQTSRHLIMGFDRRCSSSLDEGVYVAEISDLGRRPERPRDGRGGVRFVRSDGHEELQMKISDVSCS
jgi:hypothetical protein